MWPPPAVSRPDLLLVVVADPLLQCVETKASVGEDGEVRGRVTAKGRGEEGDGEVRGMVTAKGCGCRRAGSRQESGGGDTRGGVSGGDRER
jgi:hypothetical protein